MALNVYLFDKLAGRLNYSTQNYDGRDYSFKYDENYVRQKGIPISLSLPVQSEPFLATDLFPFFDNLLPEGWRKERAKFASQFPELESYFPLVSLERHGADAPGGIFFSPTSGFYEEARIDSLGASIFGLISGAQPKVLTVQDEGHVLGANVGQLSTHIAKLPSRSRPYALAVEFLVMRALKCLLPHDETAEVELVTAHDLKNYNCYIDFKSLGSGDAILLINRFDRRIVGGAVVRSQHCEEVASAMGLDAADKYKLPYDKVAAFLYEKGADNLVPILYQRIIASVLYADEDFHLKNLGIIHQEDGKIGLTPKYDALCQNLCAPYIPMRGVKAPPRRMALGMTLSRGDPREEANVHGKPLKRFNGLDAIHLAQLFNKANKNRNPGTFLDGYALTQKVLARVPETIETILTIQKGCPLIPDVVRVGLAREIRAQANNLKQGLERGRTATPTLAL